MNLFQLEKLKLVFDCLRIVFDIDEYDYFSIAVSDIDNDFMSLDFSCLISINCDYKYRVSIDDRNEFIYIDKIKMIDNVIRQLTTVHKFEVMYKNDKSYIEKIF